MKHLALIAVLALMFTGTANAEGVSSDDVKCNGQPTCDRAIDSPALPDSHADAGRLHRDVFLQA